MIENKDKLPKLLIPLLKGVVYREDDYTIWQELLERQGAIQDYISVIGLNMIIHEDEGFAFLKNVVRDDNEDDLPQLIVKRQLSYPVSLLLAQLRRSLTEHDSSSGEERLILEREEIVMMIGTFFPTGSNEVKFRRKVDAALQKTAELGFIRFIGERKDRIEVKRIIKAFVDAQWLNEFDERLKEYQEFSGLVGEETEADGE